MNKLLSFSLLFFFHFGNSQDTNLKSKWVMNFDPIIQFPLFSQQTNSMNQPVSSENDWVQGMGLELLKYYYKKNYFYHYNVRFIEREKILNTNNAIFLRENSLQLNFAFNRCFSKTTPIILNIFRIYMGGGISYTFSPKSNIHYLSNGYIKSNSSLINKHRLEALFQIGYIEDVFNVSPRTSLNKFNLLVRFPVFTSAYDFSQVYQRVDQEIEFLQKSTSLKIPFEIQYVHQFDVRKNKSGSNYVIKWTEGNWKEMSDPMKDFIPPVVNNTPPRKKFFGNFWVDYTLFRSQDSIFNLLDNQNYKLKKSFTSFSFGYTVNLFGNYVDDYNYQAPEIETYSKINRWRHNYFIGFGYKQQILNATYNWRHMDLYLPFLTVRTGVKILKGDKKTGFSLGGSYQYLASPKSYLNHTNTSIPSLPNSSIFGAVGYKNYYIKIEYENKNFAFKRQDESINLLFSIGI